MAARRFHFATICNRLDDYRALRDSMTAADFTDDNCRFTLLDNSESNRHDPYQALRDLPADGEEPYFVLCHQDLLFGPQMTFDRLSAAIDELNRLDRDWAIAGDAGISPKGERLLHLDDPTGRYRVEGLPRRVRTLDENFLLVRRGHAVVPSDGLSGFHFYGADLCLNARVAGRTCYVIDFPVQHLSGGTESPALYAARSAFIRSWTPRVWIAIVPTTALPQHFGGNRVLHTLVRIGPVRRWLQRRGWDFLPRRGRS